MLLQQMSIKWKFVRNVRKCVLRKNLDKIELVGNKDEFQYR